MDTIPRLMEKLRASDRRPPRFEPRTDGVRRAATARRASIDADWAPARPPEPGHADATQADGHASPPSSDRRSIGAILVEAGRLRLEDAQIVLREQAQQGEPFGSVAVGLGLVTQTDIDFALARQFEYPCLAADSDELEPDVIAAFEPFGQTAEHLRVLRSQLALNWLDGRGGRKSLAVTGLGRGDGRSFITANLAVLFAQMGARTLLVDADLRHPMQDTLFHVDGRRGLSSLLAGRAAGDAVIRVDALRDLFILPAGPRPPNPQELLGRPAFGRQLRSLEGLFDVVIIDTTAADTGADCQLVAAASGATLLVARQDQTALGELRAFNSALGANGGRVLGAVVNQR